MIRRLPELPDLELRPACMTCQQRRRSAGQVPLTDKSLLGCPLALQLPSVGMKGETLWGPLLTNTCKPHPIKLVPCFPQAVAAGAPGAAVDLLLCAGELPAAHQGEPGRHSVSDHAGGRWGQCRQPVSHQSDPRPGELQHCASF